MTSALQTLLATLDRLSPSEQKPVLTAAVQEVCEQEGRSVSLKAIEAAVTAQLAPAAIPANQDLAASRPWTIQHWRALQAAAKAHQAAITADVKREIKQAGWCFLPFLASLWFFRGVPVNAPLTTGQWLLTMLIMVGCFKGTWRLFGAMMTWLPHWLMPPEQAWEPHEATAEEEKRWHASLRARAHWETLRRNEVPLLDQDRFVLDNLARADTPLHFETVGALSDRVKPDVLEHHPPSFSATPPLRRPQKRKP
jgi:hypothetical protein